MRNSSPTCKTIFGPALGAAINSSLASAISIFLVTWIPPTAAIHRCAALPKRRKSPSASHSVFARSGQVTQLLAAMQHHVNLDWVVGFAAFLADQGTLFSGPNI